MSNADIWDHAELVKRLLESQQPNQTRGADPLDVTRAAISLQAMAAQITKLTAERDHAESKIKHCDYCGDDWVDSGISGGCMCTRVAQLEVAIDEHNAECEEICANSKKLGNCKPYADRGMTCPNCPREWMVSVLGDGARTNE